MPAYMTKIGGDACQVTWCPKKATYDVFNTRNAHMGAYCKAHADVQVRAMNRAAEKVGEA